MFKGEGILKREAFRERIKTHPNVGVGFTRDSES